MDDGGFWDDFERSQKFRAETLRYVRACLGLSTEKRCEKPSRIVGNFKIIGNAIRDAYNIGAKTVPPLASSIDVSRIEQRERFSFEMEVFMEMSEREQRLRLSSTVPSVEEFWAYRLGSSAVCVTLAVNE